MEPITSFKARINKNYSPDDGHKYCDWIREVDVTLGLLRTRPRNVSTYRVPSKLRAVKHEAYTPQMVSIGPFHRQNPELRAMDELKWRYMLDFVDRVVKHDMENNPVNEINDKSPEDSPQKLALNKCSKVISELEEKARAWYAEDINLDKFRLVEMLLVDGCFILELFFKCKTISMQKFQSVSQEDLFPFESLARNFAMVQTLRNDLMLLENQIPYVVLHQLFDLIYPEKELLEDFVYCFFVTDHDQEYPPTANTTDVTYIHLLDVVYHICYLKLFKLPTNYCYKNWGFTKCATELFKSGFKIERKFVKTADITLKDGVIYIPQVKIDKSSDIIFRNLIALEETSTGRHAITSYAKLMSTLIRSPADTYLLEHAGIIRASDELEDASTFFKSLCREVALEYFCFTDLCKEVNAYQIPPWRWRRVKGYFSITWFRWKESVKDLKQDYFRNRWSFIAFLAASFVIFLTLTQTFYTIRAYYPPYH